MRPSYTRDRDEFIGIIIREGGTVTLARALMRAATTLQRLAEASCNGDWPADNGERKVAPCGKCRSLWVPSTLKTKAKLCPDCRTEERVKKLLFQANCDRYPGRDFRDESLPAWSASFNGDPRGAVLRVHVPSGRDESYDGVYVPVR
jgi:hypothetical protein